MVTRGSVTVCLGMFALIRRLHFVGVLNVCFEVFSLLTFECFGSIVCWDSLFGFFSFKGYKLAVMGIDI